LRRRHFIYTPHGGPWGLDLAAAITRHASDAVCLVVRRGSGPAPKASARIAVLDLPPAPSVGRDVALRVLADVVPALRPDAVVVAGAPLGARGELAPVLARLRCAPRPPARFLALSQGDLGALGTDGDGRALRALLAWYDHALVFAERDACAGLEPVALGATGTVAVAYVGAPSASTAHDRAADELLGLPKRN
jgi:hypothetical protein